MDEYKSTGKTKNKTQKCQSCRRLLKNRRLAHACTAGCSNDKLYCAVCLIRSSPSGVLYCRTHWSMYTKCAYAPCKANHHLTVKCQRCHAFVCAKHSKHPQRALPGVWYCEPCYILYDMQYPSSPAPMTPPSTPSHLSTPPVYDNEWSDTALLVTVELDPLMHMEDDEFVTLDFHEDAINVI